jgi:hypothetical protein
MYHIYCLFLQVRYFTKLEEEMSNDKCQISEHESDVTETYLSSDLDLRFQFIICDHID